MLAITNGKIYTVSNEIINNGTILIDNGKISQIGQDIKIPEGAQVIDAGGKNIMPGFIDAHCHVGICEDGLGMEGNDGNEVTDPITPHLRAIDGINPIDKSFEEAYKSGITCLATGPGSANIIGGQFVAMKTYGRRIEDMIVKEPIAIKAALGENPKRVYGGQNKAPITRMATAAMLRDTLFKAKIYMEKKEAVNYDLLKMPKFDMKMEAMEKVIKKEIPLKIHAHRADDILTAIRIGKEFDINITVDHCTGGHLVADFIAEEGVDVVVGPSMMFRSKVEVSELTFETPAILSKAGVKIAIMTDCPATPIQYLPYFVGLAIKFGLDEKEALKAITINAAEILGIGNRVGSLEVGKDGDLIIVDGDPFLDINNRLMATIIDGKVVYQR